MKKMYSKPEILFENFTTSTNIAGDCENIVGNASKGTCAVFGTGGIAVFSDDVSACVFKPGDFDANAPIDEWDGFCYHVPVEDKTLFNS